MEEYHAGKTDEISGIEVVDEKTVKITWKEANPSISFWYLGICSSKRSLR